VPPPTVAKVFAYVTRGDTVLVFRHPDHPEAGLQVPAGTIRPGESPVEAVVREAREETGLFSFASPRPLGTARFDARPHGKDELHLRHFFELPLLGEAPERWIHHGNRSGPHPPACMTV